MYQPGFFPEDDMPRLSATQFNMQVNQIDSELKGGILTISQIKDLYHVAIIDRLYSIEKELIEKGVAFPSIKETDLNIAEKALLDLLSKSFRCNGRIQYLPTLIHELNSEDLFQSILSHMQALQPWLQEQRRQIVQAHAQFNEEQHPAKQVIKQLKADAKAVVNSDDSIESQPFLFTALSELWDNTSGDENEDGFSLFRWLVSDHYSDISSLKQQCNDKLIADHYHLLGLLLDMKDRNLTGHLQAIIAVIVNKLREQHTSDNELASDIKQGRSISLPSLGY